MKANRPSDTFMTVERNGTVEVVPVTRCMYCLGEDHLFDDCPEKHDCFMLTGHDEAFLTAVGIFYPRWSGGKFVVDPYEGLHR